MLTDGQLLIVVAGICVLAVAILVLARRRRRADGGEPGERRERRRRRERDEPIAETGSIVLARTHDGTQYQGALVEDADAGKEYLVLSGPIVFRRAGGEPETMPPAWERLALPRADIAEVWTRSTPVADPSMARNRDVVTDPTVADAPAAVRPPVYDASRVVTGPVADAPVDETRTSRRHARRRADAPTQ